MILRPPAPSELAVLIDVWHRSVRATHDFLTNTDIEQMLPHVCDRALPNLDLWVSCDEESRILGFLGLQKNSIDVLFVAPEHLRRGVGKALLQHAISLVGLPLALDVYEQNTGATQFYLANGFRPIGRSLTDGAGRPFPMLQMRRDA